jgi:hypothetical protein
MDLVYPKNFREAPLVRSRAIQYSPLVSVRYRMLPAHNEARDETTLPPVQPTGLLLAFTGDHHLSEPGDCPRATDSSKVHSGHRETESNRMGDSWPPSQKQSLRSGAHLHQNCSSGPIYTTLNTQLRLLSCWEGTYS